MHNVRPYVYSRPWLYKENNCNTLCYSCLSRFHLKISTQIEIGPRDHVNCQTGPHNAWVVCFHTCIRRSKKIYIISIIECIYFLSYIDFFTN